MSGRTAAVPAPTAGAGSRPAGAPLATAKNTALAILAMALGGFAIGTTEFASMGLLPNISRSLGVTEVQTGHLITAYALGVVVGAPILAVLGSRMQKRNLLLVLMAIIVAGHLFSAFAPGFGSLFAARFVSGLPHGAYFGVASVLAASLVPANKRGSAVAGIMMGLSVANIAGVPLTTAIGQAMGWRTAYLLVAVLGLLTVLLVRIFVPAVPVAEGAGVKTELGAMRNGRIWFILLLGAIGFGGMFAVYTFISPIMTNLAGIAESAMPWVLAAFGVGGTVGIVFGGRLADRSPTRGILVGFVLTILTFAAFSVTSTSVWASFVNVFFLGFSGSLLIPSVQTRLMIIAQGAESLAASMSHSAFNLANAVGAWLGGAVIAAGWGYLGPSRVAVLLGSLGLSMFVASLLVDRRRRAHRAPSAALPALSPVNAGVSR
ncbi:MFS transporter [Nakamurella deserti]|uniref:MFS transporter n=1 Tax=Nakamurella deserti TaxID=2164074 RepID=UPI00197BC159|nr:MFS transporter [Nakamurella deserti]